MSQLRTKLIAGVCSLGLAVASFAGVSGKVAVVNMQKVFKASPQIQTINANLKKQFSARQKVLLERRQKIQDEQNELTKNKPIMSKTAYDKAQSGLDKQRVAFSADQVSYQKDVYSAQAAAMQKFTAKMKAVIKKVAQKQGVGVVFDSANALYIAGASDLTKAVEKASTVGKASKPSS